jgi:hypothetical protein
VTLDEAREALKRRDTSVTYNRADGETEYGTITAVGRVWVFVQYPGLDHPIADRPEDLTLLAGKVPT